ncbi:MAG: hypothetical protein KatS3mg001_121 [Candidatus Pacearchaeota archaeon]|nr:MAG: hypothetical protein KatS3mg001_121 [Candidatus Pacearchaeota archaeon]
MANKTSILIGVLVFLVVVLAGILVYILVIKPAITGYTVSAQQQGVSIALTTLWQRAAQCQTIPLTLGNQTINLVAIECLQLPQQTPQTQQTPSQ